MSMNERNGNLEGRGTLLTYCPYCMNPVPPGQVCPVCHLKQGAYVPASHHLAPGTVLTGRYLIGRVLGEGGFGITYIGCDLKLEMRVAVKEYFPVDQVSRHAEMGPTVIVRATREEGKPYADGMGRFLREARTLARMEKQPEIVLVRDFFEANNTAYIVMEYVDGTSLRELMEQKGGRIPASELLPAIEPLFSALTALHREGLIHRDISPDNIMLERGQVRLLDFGCARESAGGSATMTVALKQGFAPIEQYQRKNQGPWTDVYALAATLYCCLTGNMPPSSLDRLLDNDVLPLGSLGVDLTPGQQDALMKGMEIQPKNRYQSMNEFHTALYHPVEHREPEAPVFVPVTPVRPGPAEGPRPEAPKEKREKRGKKSRRQPESYPFLGSSGEESHTPETEPENGTAWGTVPSYDAPPETQVLQESDLQLPEESGQEPAPKGKREKRGKKSRRQTEAYPAPESGEESHVPQAEPGDGAVWGTESSYDASPETQVLQEPEQAQETRENPGGVRAVPSQLVRILIGVAALFVVILVVCLVLFGTSRRGNGTEGAGAAQSEPSQAAPLAEEEGEAEPEVEQILAQTLVNCTSSDGASLLDRDAGTEMNLSWTSGASTCCLILRTDPEAEVTGYSMVTAQDATGERSCNPASWTLYGSTENLAPGSSKWVQLDQQKEDKTLPGAGCVRCDFSLEEGVSYEYYMLKITDNHGGSNLKLSEFSLLAESMEFSYEEPNLGILHSGVDRDLNWRILTDGTLVVYGDGDVTGDANWQTYAEEITQGYASITGCGCLERLFSNLTSLESFTFELLDTRAGAEVSGEQLFLNCPELEQVTFQDADLSGVTSLDRAFAGCVSLMALDLCDVSLTHVASAEGMLEVCNDLAALVLDPGFPSVALPEGAGQTWTSQSLDTCSQTESYSDQRMVYAASGSVVDRGISGDLLWVLDRDGLLTVAGRGDYEMDYRPWEEHRDQVTAARVYMTNCINPSGMFIGMTSLQTCDFGTSAFASPQDGELRMTDFFAGCTALREVNFRRMNTTGVTAYGMIFRDCSSLRQVDLSVLDGSASWAMDGLFAGCTSLTELDLTTFNCASATLTEGMLEGCTALEQITVPAHFAPLAENAIELPDPGDGFWVSSDGEVCTEIVRDADHEIIYLRCAAAVAQGVSGDLLWVIDENGLYTIVGRGDIDTMNMWALYSDLVTAGRLCVSECTSMGSVFAHMDQMVSCELIHCSFAEDAPEPDMASMFDHCSSLERVDFGGLDTSRVVSFQGMFRNCASLTEVDLSVLNPASCTCVISMFSGCTALEKLDFSPWVSDQANLVTQISLASNLIEDCTSLEELTIPARFGIASNGTLYDLPDPGAGIWVSSDGEVVTVYETGLYHEVTYLRCGAVVEQGVSQDLLWVIDDTGLLTITGVGNFDVDGNVMWSEDGGARGAGGYETTREEADYTDWRDYPELVTSGRMYVTDCGSMTNMFVCMDRMVSFRFGRCSITSGCNTGHMFENCPALESVDFGGLDASGLGGAWIMFQNCSSLRDVDFTVLGNITCSGDIVQICGWCYSLTELDLSTFRTTGIASSFLVECGSLQKVTVSANFAENDDDPSHFILPEGNWVNSRGEACTYIDGSADVQMTYTRVS